MVDGTSGNKLTESDVLRDVAKLNKRFNPFKIFFKYRGYDFIDSSRFYTVYLPYDPNDDGNDSSYTQLIEWARSNNYQYYDYNSINIYVPYVTEGFSGVSGSWLCNVIQSWSFEHENNLKDHEMGHLFGLNHTHRDWRPPNNLEYCEHVTRNRTDTLYNAETNGDKIHATAAVPDFRNEYCYEMGFEPPYYEGCQDFYVYINPSSCSYENPDGVDCQGTPYQIFPADVQNIMSYSNCTALLHIGQGIYIREWIRDHWVTLQYNRVETTIKSLYEPYSGRYYLEGPEPPPSTLPHFQPGFEYTFYECSCECPQPVPYENDSFDVNFANIILHIDPEETEYAYIAHPNHSAINIAEVDVANGYLQVKKCYDNHNRRPTGGEVIRFNDGVFNANVTITPKDSTGINNPNLIDELPGGLYKIEENYKDGTSEETVIFKGGN